MYRIINPLSIYLANLTAPTACPGCLYTDNLIFNCTASRATYSYGFWLVPADQAPMLKGIMFAI